MLHLLTLGLVAILGFAPLASAQGPTPPTDDEVVARLPPTSSPFVLGVRVSYDEVTLIKHLAAGR